MPFLFCSVAVNSEHYGTAVRCVAHDAAACALYSSEVEPRKRLRPLVRLENWLVNAYAHSHYYRCRLRNEFSLYKAAPFYHCACVVDLVTRFGLCGWGRDEEEDGDLSKRRLG